jgi:hypothetical protein
MPYLFCTTWEWPTGHRGHFVLTKLHQHDIPRFMSAWNTTFPPFRPVPDADTLTETEWTTFLRTYGVTAHQLAEILKKLRASLAYA